MKAKDRSKLIPRSLKLVIVKLYGIEATKLVKKEGWKEQHSKTIMFNKIKGKGCWKKF